jgi:hypothetical protein
VKEGGGGEGNCESEVRKSAPLQHKNLFGKKVRFSAVKNLFGLTIHARLRVISMSDHEL